MTIDCVWVGHLAVIEQLELLTNLCVLVHVWISGPTVVDTTCM